jgi:hypothetical protein
VPIGALRLAVDDPSTQDQPKVGVTIDYIGGRERFSRRLAQC